MIPWLKHISRLAYTIGGTSAIVIEAPEDLSIASSFNSGTGNYTVTATASSGTGGVTIEYRARFKEVDAASWEAWSAWDSDQTLTTTLGSAAPQQAEVQAKAVLGASESSAQTVTSATIADPQADAAGPVVPTLHYTLPDPLAWTGALWTQDETTAPDATWTNFFYIWTGTQSGTVSGDYNNDLAMDSSGLNTATAWTLKFWSFHTDYGWTYNGITSETSPANPLPTAPSVIYGDLTWVTDHWESTVTASGGDSLLDDPPTGYTIYVDDVPNATNPFDAQIAPETVYEIHATATNSYGEGPADGGTSGLSGPAQ